MDLVIVSKLWLVYAIEALILALIVLLLIQVRQHYQAYKIQCELDLEQKKLEQMNALQSQKPPHVVIEKAPDAIVSDYIGAFFAD